MSKNKKNTIFILIVLLAGYFVWCSITVANYHSYVNPDNSPYVYINKQETESMFKNNKDYFTNVVDYINKNRSTIPKGAPGIIKTKTDTFIITPRDIKVLRNDSEKPFSQEVINDLDYILNTLQFTDVIIRNDNEYVLFIQRRFGETQVGVKYTKNGKAKRNIEGDWYYHYVRDYDTYKYVGRWLYDLLYN